MDEELLDRIFEAHIANGETEEQAMAAVDLAARMSAPETDPEIQALLRINERGGNEFGDFTRQGLRGLTFGASDELRGAGAALLGGDYRETRDREREVQRDLDATSPGASTLAKVAGGAALPVFAGGQTMRAGGGLLKGMAAGAAAGGASGYLGHIGESDAETLGEKSEGAILPTVVGAGIGAFAGALPATANASVARPVAKHANQFRGHLRGLSGIEHGLADATTMADDALARARSQLDEVGRNTPQIRDPGVLGVLNSGSPHMMEAVEEIAPGGFGLTTRLPGGKFGPGRLPTVSEARDVRNALRDATTRAAREPRTSVFPALRAEQQNLTNALRSGVPGFRAGDEAFASASDFSEGLGRKLAPRTGDEIEIAMREATPSMQRGMRTRLAHDVVERAGSGEGSSFLGKVVSEDVGDPMLSRVRNIFDRNDEGDEAFRELLAELRLMRSARNTSNTGRKIIAGTAIGGGLAAAGLTP